MEQVIDHVTASGGEDIAFATVGDGPVLVLAAWWTSHLELDWQDTAMRGFIETLAQRHTVVHYDRPGVGLSGRADRPYDLDAETDYLRTVVEATGADQVDLLGISCGGPSAIRLAADDPDRARSLVLFSSYVTGDDISDHATRSAVTDLVRANWGLGSHTLTNLFLPGADSGTARRFARSQRHTASADVAASLLDLSFQLDASAYVGQLDLPVLVLHRAHDRVVEADLGRKLAAAIPGATYEELEGTAHIPWTADCAQALDSIETFLTGEPSGPPAQRRLATVCFIDVVGSTEILSAIGDRRWRDRLDTLAALNTEEAGLRNGVVVKDTGDGALVTFDVPGQALEFCQAVRARARRVDLDLRFGLHTGEIEQRDDDITGIAVVVAARVAALAESGEIVTTRTVADMVQGGSTTMVEHGVHELKGVDGEWPLFLAAPDRDQRPGPAPIGRTKAGCHHFGDFELDTGAFELRHDGAVITIEPQVFDVLQYLVEHAGELVTKEQLLDDVWGDRFVSDSTLTSRIRSARLAVGDDGKRQAVIQTVHGRGYRFIAEVR